MRYLERNFLRGGSFTLQKFIEILTDNHRYQKGDTMKMIQTNAAPAAIGPYSQGWITGNLVFTSGQIPLGSQTGEVVGTTIAAQAEQAIKNLKAVLEAAGSSLTKVVKTTCYLTDMGDFAAFNEVYAKHFVGKPARSCVAVKALPKNVLCEIEAIAEV
jgi:2-iminobutanoate/2-iminopropanoate deaminase